MIYSIAIAAEATYTAAGCAGPWPDDQELKAALEARGHRVTIISWEDPTIDLLQFDTIFVSTTWNASAHPAAFSAWLDACASDGRRRLINDYAVLAIGAAKSGYWGLLEAALRQRPALQALGQLTPSRFYSTGESPNPAVEMLAGRGLATILAELAQDAQWADTDLVLKPALSADGHGTFVYNRSGRAIPIDDDKRTQFVVTELAQAEVIFQRLAADVARGGVILQPYMRGVEAGEYSLTFFGPTCVHAVRKPPLFKGDQSQRRQVLNCDQLPTRMRTFAEGVINCMHTHFGAGAISRSRVDLFYQDGVPILCEWECVAPNTNISLVAQQRGAEEAWAIFATYADVIEQRTASNTAYRVSDDRSAASDKTYRVSDDCSAASDKTYRVSDDRSAASDKTYRVSDDRSAAS
ncbi:MAG: hypothetical protein HGA65_08355, partial [Oscillochloris sp.]|nr:hypothetical protein [Oscillochloris sp.]